MADIRRLILSPRVLAEVAWDRILISDEERLDEMARLRRRLNGLEALRQKADYNTGSIAFAAAWCLYSLVRQFGASRIIEVGTFIGKSTIAMASAMDDDGAPGEVFTCDMSNRLDLPWDGQSRITQFQATGSTDMLKQLTGSFDFAFLDGRVSVADVEHLERLLTSDAIVALDDFEGMEKGVANLSVLRSRPRFANHALVYPAPTPLLRARGFTSYSLTAFLMPASRLQIAAQG